jgi:hypothetical protein
MKTRPLLPLVVAGTVAVADVFGPHEPHIELHLRQQGPLLVGTAADIVASSTATVTMWRSSMLEDF